MELKSVCKISELREKYQPKTVSYIGIYEFMAIIQDSSNWLKTHGYPTRESLKKK